MKNVLAVFSCDAWHSHDSKNFIGVFDSIDDFFNVSKIKFSDSEKKQLIDISQTQGREENFIVEETEINSINLCL